MDTTRQNKISRLIQKELGEIFRGEVSEIARGTMISVTNARVTSDLSIAKIYLSVFPGEHKDEILHNILHNNSKIRYLLGQKVGKQLRIIPELQFFIDDSLDYIDNIDKLLQNN